MLYVNMYMPATAMIAIALIALLSSNVRFSTERYWFRISPWAKGLICILLLSGVVFLGQQGARRAAENYWLARYTLGLPEAYSPAQVAILLKAFAIEPKNFDPAYKIGA